MDNTAVIASLVIILVVILLFTCRDTESYANAIPLSEVKNSSYINRGDVVLFWTGGIDSTFRLCQLLIDERKYVQPIYIIDNSVDGIPGGRRRSWKREVKTMNNIIETLHKKYPHTRNTLRPTLYIDNIQLSPDVLNASSNLHHLGFASRPVTQWSYMAQVATELALDGAEVGIIDEASPHFRKALMGRVNAVNWSHAIKPDCAPLYDNFKFVDKRNREKYLFNKMNYAQAYANTHQPSNWSHNAVSTSSITYVVDPKYDDLRIYRNLQFPLYNMRKNDLINYANTKSWGDVLTITWSCWNPIMGYPCNMCEMCKDRNAAMQKI